MAYDSGRNNFTASDTKIIKFLLCGRLEEGRYLEMPQNPHGLGPGSLRRRMQQLRVLKVGQGAVGWKLACISGA